MGIETVISSIAALFIGGVITWVIIVKATNSSREKILREAEAEAEVNKKEKILQAKEKFLHRWTGSAPGAAAPSARSRR